MGSNYRREQERPQLTPEELDAHYIRQAQERRRRGQVGFTRPERERDVTNRTPGMNTAHDVGQKARERRGGSR